MKKSILLLTLALLLLVGRTQAQVSNAYQARLQFVLDSVCNKYNIKGASAAVFVPGAGIWKGVHGDSHAGQPITSDMLFGYGSNTKTYMAALILKLQEDGLLQLSDTIGRWIVNKPNIPGRVTIRQLLNHTSGIYSYTDNAAFGDSIEADFTRTWQPEEMLRFVNAPVFAPGAGWDYSNTNYLLAGMIISQVTGMPFQQALRNRILTPASLQRTWMYPLESYSGTLPHVWFYTTTGQVDGASLGYDHRAFFSAAGAAGALLGTAEDNVLFWQKMISGQIVNAASLAEWRRTVTLNSNISYGLGMFRYRNFNGRVIYTHGGTGFGFVNENLADSTSGVCISLLTNQDSVDNDILFEKVVAALHKVTITPPTAVNEASADIQVKVFPNPATSYVIVKTPADNVRATLVNTLGQQMMPELEFSRKTTISTQHLAPGNYYLMLQHTNGSTKTINVGKL